MRTPQQHMKKRLSTILTLFVVLFLVTIQTITTVSAAGDASELRRTTGTHTCTYVQKWSDTEHWMECECGEVESGSRAAHSPQKGICTMGIFCECGYEMTAAASEHNWSEWEHMTTTHTRRCMNADCGIAETKNCSGGEATCTVQAVCEVCGGSYGNFLSHDYSESWAYDGSAHWHQCKNCDAQTDNSYHNDANNDRKCDTCGNVLCEHTGGEATCAEKATCTLCGEKYGELAAHKYKAELSGDEATGYFRECVVCGYKKAAETIGDLTPSIIYGNYGKWTKGGNEGLEFSSDALSSDFIGVFVDGKLIDPEYYEMSGNITIKLKPSYLETLSEREHTITIRSENGDASTGFIIEAKPVSALFIVIPVLVVVLIGAGIAIFLMIKRKKQPVE